MDSPAEEVKTRTVLKYVNQNKMTVIDVRSPDAYNGWRLRGEKRGGHIPGARSLPARWTAYIDWPDIVQGKGISQNTPLLIYGYESEAIDTTAKRFKRAGYSRVKVYYDFAHVWTENPDLPLEQLKRCRYLVPPSWLRQLSSGEKPEMHENDKHVICHAHYRSPSAYENGHIPGAVAVDTNMLESPETWNRRSPMELKKTLEALGIRWDTTVILYGRFSFPDRNDPFPGSSAGQLAAIRAAVIMLYAGVSDVRILNGGLQSWVDAGYEISTEETKPVPTDDFGARIPVRPHIFIDTPEAKDILRSENKNLVSVRSWPEFIGETSGYNYIEKKGRIPGAVFGNCGQDAYHMENYRNRDNTTREYGEIEALWAEAGITPDKMNAFYCGTGWRGSEAFFNAWLMGWPAAAVYDGGWYEWSGDENNPYETGIPTQEHVTNSHTRREI